MTHINRREFVYGGIVAAAALAAGNARAAGRKFTIAFIPGSIGVEADQGRSIELAAKYGFESVQPFGPQLLKEGVTRYVEALKSNKLQWAAAKLSVSLSADEEAFSSGLAALPQEAKALQQAGVSRVGTSISSRSDTLTYLENFKQTSSRLRQVGSVLEDHGLRLGLEYLGTKRLWTARRHAFVHSMKECRQLIAGAGKSNIGVVIDSWHWWTARETADDILQLSNSNVVSADLNDAPRRYRAGIAVRQPARIARDNRHDRRKSVLGGTREDRIRRSDSL